MPHKLTCVVTGLLVLSTVACSGEKPSGSAGSGASHPDPCTLVTAADAEAILGTSVEQTKPEGLSLAAACQYLAPTAENVTLQVHFGLGTDFDNYVKTAEESFASKAFPVPGVGEKAMFNAEQLIVKHGDDFFILTIGKAIDDKQRLPIASDLAHKVVSRLGAGSR